MFPVTCKFIVAAAFSGRSTYKYKVQRKIAFRPFYTVPVYFPLVVRYIKPKNTVFMAAYNFINTQVGYLTLFLCKYGNLFVVYFVEPQVH